MKKYVKTTVQRRQTLERAKVRQGKRSYEIESDDMEKFRKMVDRPFLGGSAASGHVNINIMKLPSSL